MLLRGGRRADEWAVALEVDGEGVESGGEHEAGADAPVG